MSISILIKDFIFYSGLNALRYILIAGVSYLIVWKWGKKTFAERKIPSRLANRKNDSAMLKIEIGYSLLTMTIVGFIHTLMELLSSLHFNLIYFDIANFGWAYFFFSIVALICIHDTYFYFLHRLLHHPKLYKKAHATHHLSMSPTPFAAYSFHPLEALLTSLFLILVTTVMPIHINALVVFFLIWTLANINGHLGYDLLPKNKWINNATGHHMHHQWINGNYGLYFTFWDRKLGTWKEL